MAAYEDGLYAVYGRGGEIQAAALLDQSIVSSELVSVRIPPGVYADRGILLFQQGKLTDAVVSITKEGELYPESKQFTQRLLELIQENKVEQESISFSSEHRTTAILILPPVNKSGAPEAGLAFEMTLSRQFIERGYYAFPLLATKVLLRGSGRKPDQAQGVESSSLKRLTGADALLYVTITEWAHTGVFVPSVRAAAEYQLVDATTGRELWRSSAHGEFDTTVTGGVGGPVYAVTTDLRVPARMLTRQAITSSQDGLPYGPYH
jgi:hypothetical protein